MSTILGLPLAIESFIAAFRIAEAKYRKSGPVASQAEILEEAFPTVMSLFQKGASIEIKTVGNNALLASIPDKLLFSDLD